MSCTSFMTASTLVFIVFRIILEKQDGWGLFFAIWCYSGPTLFLLYISPLLKYYRQFKNTSDHLYADDLQLYFSFREEEVHIVSELLEWYSSVQTRLTEKCLQLDARKTEKLINAPDIKKSCHYNSSWFLGLFCSVRCQKSWCVVWAIIVS